MSESVTETDAVREWIAHLREKGRGRTGYLRTGATNKTLLLADRLEKWWEKWLEQPLSETRRAELLLEREQLRAEEKRWWGQEKVRQYQRERKDMGLPPPERRKDIKLSDGSPLTPKVYQAVLDYQRGQCGICMKPLLPADRAAADHDHKTKLFRGVLCQSCNFGRLSRFEAGGGRYRNFFWEVVADSPEVWRLKQGCRDYLANPPYQQWLRYLPNTQRSDKTNRRSRQTGR